MQITTIFKKAYPAILIAMFLGCSNGTEDQRVNNSSINYGAQLSEQLTSSVLWYKFSSEMRANYYQAFNYGKIIVTDNLKQLKKGQKAAVVFDVDETVLDNSPFEAEIIYNNLAYTDSLWSVWVYKANAKALPGALEFTKYLQNLGIEVFYITNREQQHKGITIKNLISEGFPFADSAHVLTKEPGKSNKTERRNLVSDNFQIILLVGDNLRDFDEKFSDRSNDLGFKAVDENAHEFGTKYLVLPNPMYGEWEKGIYQYKKEISDSVMFEMRRNIMKTVF